MQVEDVKTDEKRCTSRRSERTKRQVTGGRTAGYPGNSDKQRVNSNTKSQQAKVTSLQRGRTHSSQVESLLLTGGGGQKASVAECVSFCVIYCIAWQKHTVQQLTGSTNVVLLFFFFFFVLWKEVLENQISGVWLLNGPLGWCGRVKVLVMCPPVR